jgi:tight adherence protein C
VQINREQRAGKPRIEAWRSMATRTRLPDIEAFVNMLVQTERFGTPIARALSVFADGLRLKRRQVAEERAAKMLGPVAGILAGSFIPKSTFLWIVLLVVIGYMFPEFAVDRMIKKRRERIRKGIPDSIDLLVICVDAGLGLDQAMLRVGHELAVSHPEINEELVQINREQRAGKPRIEAWRSMATRTRLPDIEAFVNMLVQTERFGTPIARALSVFADGLRLKRRQVAEERAAKTTVKIVFPLVIFIFPCMFITLLGPAIIKIMHGMSVLMK